MHFTVRAMLARISCHRVSVRLSVTSRSCTKMAIPRITLTTPCDSLGTLVFLLPKISVKIQPDRPVTGAQNRGGANRRFSTNISLYLRNGARWGHSYYETLIGIRMRSIEWRYFQ